MSLQDSLEKLKNDFSNLDPENMGGWPLPVKVVCWLLTAIIVVVLSYQFVLSAQQDELNQEVQKEATLKTSFESKVRDAANLEAYEAQMREMSDSFNALLKQLPKDTEVPGLLDDISNTGQASGLNIEAIDLLPEKKADFYVELPINIKVTGGYHDFGSFVSGIAGLPRIVTLHDFVIQSSNAAMGGANAPRSTATKEDDSGARSGDELSMTIMAKTYRYKSAEEAERDADKAAKTGKGGGK
jgi:type IV pilus assembly protein PilO